MCSRAGWALIVAVAACAPPPPPVAERAPAVQAVPSPVCPDAFHAAEWDRELFPGCPPRPFGEGVVCYGECPRPCEALLFDPQLGRQVANRYTYDADGHWLSTASDASTGGSRAVPRPRGQRWYCGAHDCTYVAVIGGRERDVVGMHVERDSHGTVVAFSSDQGQVAARFGYDRDNRLIAEHQPAPGRRERRFDYTYDPAGRLAHVESHGWGNVEARAYAYDERGRLASLTLDVANIHRVTAYEYDAQDRPTRITSDETTPGVEPKHAEDDYRYECAAAQP